ncbi:DUF3153 domain-containing protein [Bacillus sp. V59.32b]|uniref:LppM family (lipo)protein n=1 Tax=Bacillus sp. V59.32b TaxID=1758642 RepID=UPI001359B780|nr:DUF3153 domain-containing protein [Bacillus sp. V59.32b]
MKKHLGVLICLLTFVLVLTGCVKVDTSLKINSDGSSDLTLVYGIDKQIASFGGTDITNDLEDTKQEAEKEGFKAIDYNSERYIGLTLKKHFESFEDMKSPSDEQQLFDFKVKETKGFFTDTYKVDGVFDFTGMTDDAESEEFDQQMVESMISQMELTFNLELPVEAGENNATEVKNIGKELVWNFTPNAKNDVDFEFKKINYVNIALLAIGALLVIIFVFLFVRRKNKQANPPGTPAE